MKTHLCAVALGIMLLTARLPDARADFGGKPPLGPERVLRHEFAPYDMAELNCLALNYCENLCDMRVNLTSYTHLDYDINAWDAWNLQFPDDTSRFVEALAWEAQYSPVVRLELARRLLKGLMAAHIPGTRAEYFFRHRSDGKTHLIFDDQEGENKGRLTLSTWGDNVEGALKVGFRAKFGEQWQPVEAFKYADTPPAAGHPIIARTGGSPDDLDGDTQSSPNWNESPYSFTRHYTSDSGAVDFTGRYWFSDANKPLEYAFASTDADAIDIVIGEPGKHMTLLWDYDPNNIPPGIIHLPDRKTEYHSDQQGTVTLERPDFNYFILRKKTVWCSRGYSSAFIVMWEGQPASITALADNGYGEIRLRYDKQGEAAAGRVWLYPVPWLNDDEIAYLYRNAESFLATGQLMQNGYPSQQMVNAVPAGLAAGAWLLTKYNDPAAPAVRVQAENAVDAMILPEAEGRYFIRAFFEVKAAAWMLMLGKEMNDQRLIDKYTPWVEKTMERMMSPYVAYDGKAWPDGWAHFNSMKALWMAWQLTGREDYREAYERAMAVYTIDEKGIYRNGEALKAPGGFDTYSGALPLGVWGHAGQMDKVNLLINLDVPNGWDPDPTVPVREIWHDGGAGPWAQDDSQPDFAGFCLRGLDMPREKQYLVPVGSGVMYDALGNVRMDGGHIIDNPFLMEGNERLVILMEGEKLPAPASETIEIVPGAEAEQSCMISEGGRVSEGKRIIENGADPVVYAFPAGGDVTGATLDMTLGGDAYQVAVSPDGQCWHQRLDSWSNGPERRALDISFLTGNADELIRIDQIDPATDGAVLVREKQTRLERGHCRYIDKNGSFVYRLALPDVVRAQVEVIVGNGYRIEISPDGRRWRTALRADKIPVKDDKHVADASWLRMVDLTPVLGDHGGDVYIRFSDLGQPETFGGKQAFLRRLNIYGVYKSGKIYVRLTGAGRPDAAPLAIDNLTLRTWSR